MNDANIDCIERQHKLQSLIKQVHDLIEAYNRLSRDTNADNLQMFAHKIKQIKEISCTFRVTDLSEKLLCLDTAVSAFSPLAQDEESVTTQRLAIKKAMAAVVDASKQLNVIEEKVHSAESADSNVAIEEKKTPENTQVYILEDNDMQAGLLESNLKNFGFNVEVFLSLDELVARYDSYRPHILISDLNLPGVPESRLFTFINSLAKEGIPVIALSANSGFSYRLAAVRASCSGYYTKPVNITTLYYKICELLKLKQHTPYKIIMVDDEKSILLYYSELFCKQGIEFKGVNNPLNLLDDLEDFDPDVFVFDYHMKAFRGDELASVIRQFDCYDPVPILFLTGSSQKDLKTELVATGSDDVLNKSIHADDFIAQVISRMQRGRYLKTLMHNDRMSNLLNHTYIKQAAQNLFVKAKRKQQTLTTIIIDLDHFKAVNDTYGHEAGDRVILLLAQLLLQRLRHSDKVGRYGGEEFYLALPNTSKEKALPIVETILTQFREITFNHVLGDFRATFSAGIADSSGVSSLDEQFKKTDAALYLAKRNGRSRIELSD